MTKVAFFETVTSIFEIVGVAAMVLGFVGAIVLDATDSAGLARAIAPPDRTTTVIVRGDCPAGARYGTMEC